MSQPGHATTWATALRPEGRAAGAAFDIAIVAAASLVLAASAQIAVSLPFSPVPVTAQTLAVVVLAALLGRTRGVLAVALYITEGALGMPVFARGQATLAAYKAADVAVLLKCMHGSLEFLRLGSCPPIRCLGGILWQIQQTLPIRIGQFE